MKQIFKLAKEISKYYKNYQLRITKDLIEVKFTPRKDDENEVVFLVKNDRFEREGMKGLLHKHIKFLNNQ